jgi:seryl-tRNA synthetase
MTPATKAETAFHDELVRHGLIIPCGVPGVFGRGAVFEDILDRFNRYVSTASAGDGADQIHFPPVVVRKVFEKSEFLDSFPQLAGSVFSFTGTDAQHQELSAKIHAGEDWSHLQTMTDVVLTPAACYPVYPTFTGTLPKGGRLVDLQSYCFRHEPSADPARMQMFRVRENVRVGNQDEVISWRQMWLERGHELLLALKLPARVQAASDPFFGRGGRLLAANQKEQQLKFEILVPICSEETPTAVVSFNYHQDHFGSLFAIKSSDGACAQTACIGFGMERVVMALLKTHGFVPTAWPADVRRKLWT